MQNIIKQSKEKKDLLTLALLSIMILIPSIIYSIVTDNQSFFITIFMILILSFAIRKPIQKGKRETIYILILSIIGANIINQLFTLSDARFFLPPIKFYCSMFILGATFYSFTPLTRRKINIIIALSLIAYLSAGNIINNYQPNKSFTLVNPLINSFHITYGSFMLIQTLAILLVIPKAEQHTTYNFSTKKYLYKYAIIIITLFSSFATTGILGYNIYKHRSGIQYSINSFIKKYISYNANDIVFDNEQYIDSIKRYSDQNQRQVIMRIMSQQAPGYIRNNAYVLYKRGAWTNENQPKTYLNGIKTAPNSTSKSYIIPTKKDSQQNTPQQMDIYIASHVKMSTIPMPGNTINIIITAKELKYNVDGVVSTIEENAIPREYKLKTQNYKFQVAYSNPEPLKKIRKYKRVPKNLHKTLSKTLSKIFPEGYKKLTPQEKAEQITKYFAKNYKYSLTCEEDDFSGSDNGTTEYKNPLRFFLKKSKIGHCELFATATVLLLRETNVPARYITGFLCHEKHPNQNYYITRLKDAHAWTEIYLQKEKRWILIDSTPANGKPSTEKHLTFISAFLDNIILKYQNFIKKIKNKNFSAIIITAIIAMDKIITWSFTHPLSIIIFIILTISIYYMLKNKRDKKNKKVKSGKTPLDNALKLINKLLKKNKITKKSSMTLRELNHKIDENPQIIYAQKIKQIILSYEKLRYSQSHKIEDINLLIKATKKLVKTKPKLKKQTIE